MRKMIYRKQRIHVWHKGQMQRLAFPNQGGKKEPQEEGGTDKVMCALKDWR